jgi:hypothetical protein
MLVRLLPRNAALRGAALPRAESICTWASASMVTSPLPEGEYEVSFAAARRSVFVPLWVLFIAVQLLDFGRSVLVLFGVEKVRIVPGITASNPLDLYYMPYTHSLVAALLWSAGAFAAYRLAVRRGRNTAAFIVAAAVFSHWIPDFVVHREANACGREPPPDRISLKKRSKP